MKKKTLPNIEISDAGSLSSSQYSDSNHSELVPDFTTSLRSHPRTTGNEPGDLWVRTEKS